MVCLPVAFQPGKMPTVCPVSNQHTDVAPIMADIMKKECLLTRVKTNRGPGGEGQILCSECKGKNTGMTQLSVRNYTNKTAMQHHWTSFSAKKMEMGLATPLAHPNKPTRETRKGHKRNRKGV